MSSRFAPITSVLKRMKHSSVSNYATAGLTSHLIGGAAGFGKVRLFTSSRETTEFVTPHSHKFCFGCMVLEGRVENTIYTRETTLGSGTDLWYIGQLTGELGVYNYTPGDIARAFSSCTSLYSPGDVYGMDASTIHSIKFSRGSQVLFFEGPRVNDVSQVLEPCVNGHRVPTFKAHPWMFQRGGFE